MPGEAGGYPAPPPAILLMDLGKELLARLQQLGLNGPSVLLVAAVGLFFWSSLTSAVAAQMKSRLEKLMGHGHWLRFTLLYVMLPAIVFVAGFPLASVTMVLCGGAVLIADHRLRRPILLPRFIVAQVIVFGLLVAGLAGWKAYRQNVERKRTRVYSLLATEPHGIIDNQTLVKLSDDYTAALQQAFAGVNAVQVQPSAFDSAALVEYDYRRGRWKTRKRLVGDVVISTSARLFDGPSVTDPVVHAVWRLEGLPGYTPAVSADAPSSEARLVALRALFEFLTGLRSRPGWVTRPEQERIVKQNILREYLRVMEDLGELALRGSVEAALNSPDISDQQMRDIFKTYPRPEWAQWTASRDPLARTTALGKVGLR